MCGSPADGRRKVRVERGSEAIVHIVGGRCHISRRKVDCLGHAAGCENSDESIRHWILGVDDSVERGRESLVT